MNPKKMTFIYMGFLVPFIILFFLSIFTVKKISSEQEQKINHSDKQQEYIEIIADGETIYFEKLDKYKYPIWLLDVNNKIIKNDTTYTVGRQKIDLGYNSEILINYENGNEKNLIFSGKYIGDIYLSEDDHYLYIDLFESKDKDLFVKSEIVQFDINSEEYMSTSVEWIMTDNIITTKNGDRYMIGKQKNGNKNGSALFLQSDDRNFENQIFSIPNGIINNIKLLDNENYLLVEVLEDSKEKDENMVRKEYIFSIGENILTSLIWEYNDKKIYTGNDIRYEFANATFGNEVYGALFIYDGNNEKDERFDFFGYYIADIYLSEDKRYLYLDLYEKKGIMIYRGFRVQDFVVTYGPLYGPLNDNGEKDFYIKSNLVRFDISSHKQLIMPANWDIEKTVETTKDGKRYTLGSQKIGDKYINAIFQLYGNNFEQLFSDIEGTIHDLILSDDEQYLFFYIRKGIGDNDGIEKKDYFAFDIKNNEIFKVDWFSNDSEIYYVNNKIYKVYESRIDDNRFYSIFRVDDGYEKEKQILVIKSKKIDKISRTSKDGIMMIAFSNDDTGEAELLIYNFITKEKQILIKDKKINNIFNKSEDDIIMIVFSNDDTGETELLIYNFITKEKQIFKLENFDNQNIVVDILPFKDKKQILIKSRKDKLYRNNASKLDIINLKNGKAINLFDMENEKEDIGDVLLADNDTKIFVELTRFNDMDDSDIILVDTRSFEQNKILDNYVAGLYTGVYIRDYNKRTKELFIVASGGDGGCGWDRIILLNTITGNIIEKEFRSCGLSVQNFEVGAMQYQPLCFNMDEMLAYFSVTKVTEKEEFVENYILIENITDNESTRLFSTVYELDKDNHYFEINTKCPDSNAVSFF